MIISHKITTLWDEWLIFRLGNPESEASLRLPLENPFKDAAQEKRPREGKIAARSRTKARRIH
jgi:hypothetical protein